jgi:hypothetical protein
MVSCDITADSIESTIQNKKRQLGTNEAPEVDVMRPAHTAATAVSAAQSHNHFGYLAKFTAVTMIATCVLSSVSAFTQPRNQMGVLPVSLSGKRRSHVPSACGAKHPLLSFTSRTKLSFAANTDSSASTRKSDQQEWKAVFQALQLYKAAYGDLKVPAKFVVPSAAPWPGM